MASWFSSAQGISKRYPPHGKALPKQIEVKLSRDGAQWETVYDNKALTGDPSGRTEALSLRHGGPNRSG